MKRLLTALMICTFALSASAQKKQPSGKSSSKKGGKTETIVLDSAAQALQDSVSKLSESQKRVYEAKQKRDAEAIKRKEATAARKAEADKHKQELASKRPVKTAPAAQAVTDSTGAPVATVDPRKAARDEQMKAAAEKRKQQADQRKAESEKRKAEMSAKRPGAKTQTTTSDSTTKDSTSGAATETKADPRIAAKQARDEQMKAAAEKRKTDADKRKQEMQEKKEAGAQLKQAKGPKTGGTAEGGAAKVKEKKEPVVHAKPTHGSKGKTKEEPEVVVESQTAILYYSLPITALPQLRNYIEDKEDQDSKDLRKGFIQKEDAQRGYIHLQRAAENDKFTRIQMYNTKENKQLLVIETSSCTPDCNNTLKMFMRIADGWQDVSEQYMPQLDKKYVLGRIKSKYKKQYMDNEVYNAKGYETSEEFYKSAIVYDISPDANKIIIRDQFIDYPVYDMVWNMAKGKFDLNKL